MSKKSIADIKSEFQIVPIESILEVLSQYKNDDRAGVQKLITSYKNKYKKYQEELIRLEKMKEYEKKYNEAKYICGIDEVGRGPFAGPVVTSAVILPNDVDILYINDSKKLSQAKREELYEEIKEKAIAISIGVETSEEIDNTNILQATIKAMESSVNKLEVRPEVILIDAVTLKNIDIQQEAIIGGDGKSISIAAASIIAKVTRDKMMEAYDKIYPEYKFAKNKGYGTKEHIEALEKYGPTPIHRRSFIKNFCS